MKRWRSVKRGGGGQTRFMLGGGGKEERRCIRKGGGVSLGEGKAAYERGSTSWEPA